MINNKANITSILFSFVKISVYRLVKRQKKRTFFIEERSFWIIAIWNYLKYLSKIEFTVSSSEVTA